MFLLYAFKAPLISSLYILLEYQKVTHGTKKGRTSALNQCIGLNLKLITSSGQNNMEEIKLITF